VTGRERRPLFATRVAGTAGQNRRFERFLAAGAIAAAANFGSRFVFSQWMRFELAVLCAFVVGLAVGFALMRNFVFDAAGKSCRRQLVWFVAINLLAAAQTFVISVVLARWALPTLGIHRYAEAMAHLVGVVTPIVSSYFGHRLFTFA